MRLIAQVVPDGLYSQNVCLKRVYHGRVDYTRISSCGTAHGITWTDYVFYIFRGGKGGMIVSVYQGREIRLPHDAMISEKRTQDSAGGINTGWFEGYDYVYEKEFDVPKEEEGRYVSFEFEGVYRNADQPNSRWYSGAGIYRPVWMYTAPAGHILQNGIRVRTISTEPLRFD